MSKKIFAILIVAVVAGYNVYQSQKGEMMSDLMLANVEALAGGEIIVGMPCVCVPNSWCMYFYPWEQWEEPGAFYN